MSAVKSGLGLEGINSLGRVAQGLSGDVEYFVLRAPVGIILCEESLA